MGYSEETAERIRGALKQLDGITEKKMFGGLSFMYRGNMCCGIANDSLVVRVGPAAWEATMEKPHTRPMDFTGRSLKGMVYVDPAGYAEDEDLADWVSRGVEFAGSLAPK